MNILITILISSPLIIGLIMFLSVIKELRHNQKQELKDNNNKWQW